MPFRAAFSDIPKKRIRLESREVIIGERPPRPITIHIQKENAEKREKRSSHPRIRGPADLPQLCEESHASPRKTPDLILAHRPAKEADWGSFKVP